MQATTVITLQISVLAMFMVVFSCALSHYISMRQLLALDFVAALGGLVAVAYLSQRNWEEPYQLVGEC